MRSQKTTIIYTIYFRRPVSVQMKETHLQKQKQQMTDGSQISVQEEGF